MIWTKETFHKIVRGSDAKTLLEKYYKCNMHVLKSKSQEMFEKHKCPIDAKFKKVASLAMQ